MTAQPKWQRVRYLTDAGPVARGAMLWVMANRHVGHGGARRYLANLPVDHRQLDNGALLFWVNSADVELLPEFSFADDPDAEVAACH